MDVNEAHKSPLGFSKFTLGLATPWPDAAKPVGWRAAVVGLFAADSYPAPAASVAVPRTVTTQRGAFFGRRGLDPSFLFLWRFA